MKRSETGFTLLEVLAAVALLGILYTTLAGVAIQGLRAEGIAQRKLEASLLADQRLAQIELQMKAGIVPGTGSDEEEADIFRIETNVEPFEVPLPIPASGESGDGMGSLLGTDGAGDAPLRRIQLRVSWLEGVDERAVIRTTYGFDAASFASGLPLDGASLEDLLAGGLGGLGGGGSSGNDAAGTSLGGGDAGGSGRIGTFGRGLDRKQRRGSEDIDSPRSRRGRRGAQ